MKRLALRAARAAAALVCSVIRFTRWLCFTAPRFPWPPESTEAALGATRRELAAAWGAPERSASEAYPDADEAWNFISGPWQFTAFFKDRAAVRIFAFRKYAMSKTEFKQALAAIGGTGFQRVVPGIWKSARATAIQISETALRFDSGDSQPS